MVTEVTRTSVVAGAVHEQHGAGADLTNQIHGRAIRKQRADAERKHHAHQRIERAQQQLGDARGLSVISNHFLEMLECELRRVRNGVLWYDAVNGAVLRRRQNHWGAPHRRAHRDDHTMATLLHELTGVDDVILLFDTVRKPAACAVADAMPRHVEQQTGVAFRVEELRVPQPRPPVQAACVRTPLSASNMRAKKTHMLIIRTHTHTQTHTKAVKCRKWVMTELHTAGPSRLCVRLCQL